MGIVLRALICIQYIKFKQPKIISKQLIVIIGPTNKVLLISNKTNFCHHLFTLIWLKNSCCCIVFHTLEKKEKLLMATINGFVTNILQKIFVCVQQKKDSHTGF